MKRWSRRALVYIALIAAEVFALFPFWWMITTSLKHQVEIFGGLEFLPQAPTLDNFAAYKRRCTRAGPAVGGALPRQWHRYADDHHECLRHDDLRYIQHGCFQKFISVPSYRSGTGGRHGARTPRHEGQLSPHL